MILSDLFLALSRNSNTRIWGKCNNSCLAQSQINAIEVVATHFTFFASKHWLVYAHVTCPQHGEETWAFEKYLDPGTDLRSHPNQAIEDGTIWVSNSSYQNNRFYTKQHRLNNQVAMSDAVNAVSTTRDYDILINNCRNFSRTTYKDIKHLDTQVNPYQLMGTGMGTGMGMDMMPMQMMPMQMMPMQMMPMQMMF